MSDNIEWLIKSSGPIIRFRVKHQFGHFEDKNEREAAIEELLGCEEVKKWIRTLQESDKIHGSKDNAFENILAKLTAYGITADMHDLSDLINSVFQKRFQKECVDNDFMAGILYPFFISIGFTKDPKILIYAQNRLEQIYQYASEVYDDFAKEENIDDLLLSLKDKEDLKIPKKWLEKNVWKPEFTFLFPHCYDFYLFSYLPGFDEKKAMILRFVHTPKFQRLCATREFYRSYAWDPRKRYCWGVWEMPYLHGFYGFKTPGFSPNKFLLYLELTSRYPNAKEIDWFNSGIKHLEQFKTDKGTYIFPKEYLPEKKNKYYLYSGGHMGLGDNIEVESTFRLLSMKKLSGL